MPFGQRPQHPTAAIDATDERRDLLFARSVDVVDDQSAGRRFVHSSEPFRAAAGGTSPAGLFATGWCAAVDRGFVGVAGPGAAPTTTPPPAPTRLRFFAFRHPSDSSWRAKTLPGALAGRVLPDGRLGVTRSRIVARLGSSNVPESAQDVEFLTAAAVALNRHADVLRDLGAPFAEAGHDLYLVGGAVRDALLGRLTSLSDYDFTTDARPEQVQQILRRWADNFWDTGIEFGTVGVGKGDDRLEITTFRADRYDRVSRNPEVRFGDSLDDDLVRRDFTVNAMAVRITAAGAGEFVDPLGGLAALRAGVLDTPATPAESFGDDPLRMLRAARFVSQLGFTIAPRVRSAIEEMAPELARITAERVAAELDKLLLGGDPVAGIELMVQTGMGEVVLPEVGGMQMAIDEHHQHKDVYQHSLTVLRQAIALEDEGPDLALRWAALLHDIGKPATRKHEPDGGVSFHHHEVVGAKMARKRLRALKYSKQMVDDVSQLVYLHLRFHGYGEGRWTDSAVRRYVTDAGPLLPRLHKLVRADCTTRNQRRAARLQANYDSLEARIAELAAQEDLQRVRPDLDGNEIMELLGIPPGPQVGEAWNYLKELRLDRGPLTRDEATAELMTWWRSRGNQ
jgi:poly(A) polymerase